MSSGLYGGRGWDEPVIQVDMELDTLEPLNRRWTTVRSKLVNSQGEVAKPNERHLNWYTWRFTMNQRHFHTGLAMGMWRYVSCMLMINSPFVLSDGRHDARLGLHLEPWNDQGAVSIRKTVLLGMVIPMLKIRRPLGRLIFNMGIAIPGKTIFLIETGPWWSFRGERSMTGHKSPIFFSARKRRLKKPLVQTLQDQI